VLRRITGGLAFAALAWALAVWLSGGFSLTAGGLRVSANDPLRPLVLGVLLAALHVFIARPAGIRAELAWARARVQPVHVAALLAVAIVVVALSQTAWVVGGADAYSYVSQADLWLQGELETPMPIADQAPWPRDLSVFAPFGYRPSQGSGIVPVTAPGLSLIMAGFKAVAGHCAVFWVVPLSAGMLVWVTFAIGRRLATPAAGLAAAWLVATSPAVLAMVVSPMSDVPVAAFWTLAMLCAFGDTRRSALGAGLASAIAILVRPNLVPIAAVLGLWIAWRSLPRRPDVVAPALYAAGVLPGVLFIAWVNRRLYGSPLASGYGNLSELFALHNLPVNIARYGRWLIESQTPLFLVGGAAVLIPLRSIWKTAEARAGALLLALVGLVVWAMYIIYRPFEDWWYLRYLLTSWPAMAVGGAAVAARLADGWGWRARVVLWSGVAAVGVYGVGFARTHGAFPSGDGDYRYAAIAGLVEQSTPPSSVIITSQHAGPITYYSGRLTLRFDAMDPAWLDRTVDWLAAQGRQPFLLLEDWERPQFEQRFAGKTRFDLAFYAPVAIYHPSRSTDVAFLFDPLRPNGPTMQPPPVPRRAQCVLPMRDRTSRDR